MKQLWLDMLRIRTVEEAIADAYSEQEMRCPVHLCIGQEAVAVGVCAALDRADYAMSAHRSHGHYLAKGGDLRAMMAELYGRATGCTQGKGGSMHLVDRSAGFLGAVPIVGSTIPIGVGAAMGAVMRGESKVAAVFFGEGATEEGVFHEALNFAVLRRLPVLFVCENNLYSTYSHLRVRQPEGRTVIDLARGHGVEAHAGDGNDAVQVHALAQAAVAKARRGGGPTLFEFATYRWREHVGPFYDNDLGYRPPGEYDYWHDRDPIKKLEAGLLASGALTAGEAAAARTRFAAEMAGAIAYAKASPYPDASEMLTGVFARPVGG